MSKKTCEIYNHFEEKCENESNEQFPEFEVKLSEGIPYSPVDNSGMYKRMLPKLRKSGKDTQHRSAIEVQSFPIEVELTEVNPEFTPLKKENNSDCISIKTDIEKDEKMKILQNSDDLASSNTSFSNSENEKFVKPANENQEFMSESEIREKLTDMDFSDLTRFAGIYSWAAEREVLLHDVIVTILEGNRKCPIHVDFLTFFKNAISSHASNIKRKHERRTNISVPTREEDYDRLVDSVVNDDQMTPEEAIIEKERINRAERKWEKIRTEMNSKELLILEGLLASKKGKELCKYASATPSELRSFRRKVRMKLTKIND